MTRSRDDDMANISPPMMVRTPAISTRYSPILTETEVLLVFIGGVFAL